MTLLFVKSTLILAILWVVYYIALEREKMHHFKRWYLLLSMGLAVGIPFIEMETIAYTSHIESVIVLDEAALSGISQPLPQAIEGETNTDSLAIWWTIYVLISGVLLWRFMRNIGSLLAKLRLYPKVPYQQAQLVLLPQKILPFSFLHYIFINQKDWKTGQIEEELFTHELTHVAQKHSFDILLIELLQVIFWFNPLIYLYKKAIKLNHEFLADEGVINSCKDIPSYQHLLLDKIASRNPNPLLSLSTYSLTQKRLSMMMKNTSQTRAGFLQLAMIPLFAFLILSFSTHTEVQAQKPPAPPLSQEQVSVQNDNDSLQQIRDEHFKNVSFQTWDFKTKKLVEKLNYDELSDAEKNRLFLPFMTKPAKKHPTQTQLNSWLDGNKFGVWIDGKRIDNKHLQNYKPSDFAMYGVSGLEKNAYNYGVLEYEVSVWTHSYFENFHTNRPKSPAYQSRRWINNPKYLETKAWERK